MARQSNIVGVSDHSIARHNPLNPNPNVVYREYDTRLRGGGGGAGGVAATGGLLAHPLLLVLAILGLVIVLVYLLFQRVIKPLVRWIFRIEAPAKDANDPLATAPAATRHRILREKQEIDRAMRTKPSDPALLARIDKLTAEVESIDRAVLERLNRQALRPFHEIMAEKQARRPQTRHYGAA